jgi:hypothetical protein
MDEPTLRILALYGLTTLIRHLLSFKAQLHRDEQGTTFIVSMGGIDRIHIDTRLRTPDE